MPGILKGNFETKKMVAIKDDHENIEDRFESEALKQLGGSIAFVSKKKVKWSAKGDS
ncbi:MAG: hypothetical protein HQ503_18885 [Rhodospirillales bacterium]|nr:hypothetical protein [Rhodospirillales bacterium]